MRLAWSDFRVSVGLDLGTTCGWAALDMQSGARLGSGTWDLSIRRGESQSYRVRRLRQFLAELLDRHESSWVFYEHVERHMVAGRTNTYAAQAYGELRGQAWVVCDRLDVRYAGVTVQAAKKRATGKGNAAKGDMVVAAQARWSLALPPEEDEADALWIAECGRFGETLGAAA